MFEELGVLMSSIVYCGERAGTRSVYIQVVRDSKGRNFKKIPGAIGQNQHLKPVEQTLQPHYTPTEYN